VHGSFLYLDYTWSKGLMGKERRQEEIISVWPLPLTRLILSLVPGSQRQETEEGKELVKGGGVRLALSLFFLFGRNRH